MNFKKNLIPISKSNSDSVIANPSQLTAGFYFGENILKSLFVLLFCWVSVCLFFLVRIPFAMFVGMVKGLCRSIQDINENLLEYTPYPALITWIFLILFMLFPIFMIPFIWFALYKTNEDFKWSDILPFKNKYKR